MTNKIVRTGDAAELRKRAEEIARKKAALLPENRKILSLEETSRILHELRVHQIELEMQNEELHSSQGDLDAALTRYFDLYDLAPVGYCTISEKGLILEANLTAATLLGSTRNALVKLPITRFILKEDQDIYYLHRKQLIETGMPQECDLRMLENDGTTHWVHLAANVVQDADGVSLSRIVMSDTTERKRAEVELANEAARRRLLMEQSRDGIVILDQDGQVYESNRKFAEMLGYPLESMRRLNVTEWEFLTPPERIKEMIRCVDEKGDHFETRHRRRDGSTYDVEISTNAAWFAGQKLVLCICRDITDRKQAEEKMAEQLHELQRWHNVMLDREDRFIELKREVNELLARAGHPPRYPSAAGGDEV